MNLTDRKILAILDQNSRTPSASIAKQLRLSRQVVEYRIQQLIKNKIILNFTTLIDPTKFVKNIWHVYLKLQNLTPQKEKEVKDFLLNTKNVWWIATCEGEWDTIFSVAGNDIMQFDKFMSEFRSKFHQYINHQQITSLIAVDAFPRGYFTNKATKKHTYVSERKEVKLSQKDILLLKAIASNARKPATKIAQETHLTARQVIYRMKELQKKEVIRAFHLHLNFNQVQRDYYKVCFYADNLTKGNEQSIISWCEQQPSAIFFVKKIAPWTFEIEFEAESYKHLNSMLKDLRNAFGSIIKRTEITLITEEFKGELDILRSME